MALMESSLARLARGLGVQISRVKTDQIRLPVESTDGDRTIVKAVQPFTMTSPERIWTLLEAVRYATEAKLPGAFVECGVWRGGSIIAMVKKLQALEVANRDIWLYDTFQGMTEPTEEDIEASTGNSARSLMNTTAIDDGNNVWAFATREDVERNLRETGYPSDRFTFVQGDVAQTLLTHVPEQISILRLDTDWYESTRVGLEILYPRLIPGGVCILDDYGHWKGARKAVDDYFEEQGFRPLMSPIDYSGRIFLKTS